MNLYLNKYKLNKNYINILQKLYIYIYIYIYNKKIIN